MLAEELPPGWRGIGAIAGREDAERFAAQWRQTLYRRGLLGITWPPEYGGRGLSRLHQVVLVEELARAGVPLRRAHRPLRHQDARQHAAPVGNRRAESQRFLPRILSGEDRWCQGFSEPGAGSDLASLTTRAVLDGDELGHRRTEDLDVGGAPGQLDLPAGPDRPAGPRPRGYLVPALPARPAGHRDQADPPAHRGQRLQRGVLHRRPHAAGERSSAPRARAGRWP